MRDQQQIPATGAYPMDLAFAGHPGTARTASRAHLSATLARRLLAAARRRVDRWRHARAVRRTVQALESIDNRTLADLGIARNEIWVVAERAVLDVGARRVR